MKILWIGMFYFILFYFTSRRIFREVDVQKSGFFNMKEFIFGSQILYTRTCQFENNNIKSSGSNPTLPNEAIVHDSERNQMRKTKIYWWVDVWMEWNGMEWKERIEPSRVDQYITSQFGIRLSCDSNGQMYAGIGTSPCGSVSSFSFFIMHFGSLQFQWFIIFQLDFINLLKVTFHQQLIVYYANITVTILILF